MYMKLVIDSRTTNGSDKMHAVMTYSFNKDSDGRHAQNDGRTFRKQILEIDFIIYKISLYIKSALLIINR